MQLIFMLLLEVYIYRIERKKLGVVGLGRIGREVIQRALSYDMDILGYDPYVNESLFDKQTIKIVDLDYIIEKSDYITVHVPLNEKTEKYVDYFVKIKNLRSLNSTGSGNFLFFQN